MSRRMDREGVMRSQTQYLKNQRTWADPRCVEDERGWVRPFANWQGWDEFNHAVYALRCVIIWSGIAKPNTAPLFRDDGTLNHQELHRSMNGARIESDLRSFRFCIARSSKCDRPALP